MAQTPLKNRVLFREQRNGRTLLITRRDDNPFWVAKVVYDDGMAFSKAFDSLEAANKWLEYNG